MQSTSEASARKALGLPSGYRATVKAEGHGRDGRLFFAYEMNSPTAGQNTAFAVWADGYWREVSDTAFRATVKAILYRFLTNN
jgi:hypothetical protein